VQYAPMFYKESQFGLRVGVNDQESESVETLNFVNQEYAYYNTK
jgi:hypothetical protein